MTKKELLQIYKNRCAATPFKIHTAVFALFE
jgi:hypothetical protein